MNRLRVVMALAITAAAVRLIPLHWLHPLNWDELEFFRATLWIAEGRVPFRDFWEHHTPLAWFVFAPFAAMTGSAGAGAVIAMRWAQVPVWIATFSLINVWMRNAGIEPFARWAAMALALASSMLMIPAVEFRVDPLATLLYVAGLVLAQRAQQRESTRAAFAAGVVFCLSAFANLRMGPLLVLTVLMLRIGRGRARLNWIFAGGLAALAACMTYVAATGTVDDLYTSVVSNNYLADKHSRSAGPMFAHRMLLPFGFRILGSDRLFDPAIIDAGGIAVIVLAIAGFVFALRDWRTRGDAFVIAFAAAANMLFIATMKFIFVYHLMIAVILAIPLMALAIARLPWRTVVAVAGVAWCVNVYASVLRGKEGDLAYQNLIMTAVHDRTAPHETVWSGGPWAIRREPAYRIWFVHEIARVLLRFGRVEPYRVADPPAAIVYDYDSYLWLTLAQRELAPYFVRHYTPVWRNLWVPGLNAPLPPGARHQWAVPRDGVYRLFAAEGFARHPWFREPLAISAVEQPNAARLEIRLPAPAPHPSLQWWIDGQPARVGAAIPLRKGQRIAAMNTGNARLGVFLMPGTDTTLFRQPPPGVTLEASAPRVTHWPRVR